MTGYYLYSKLWRSGVSAHIGTGGDLVIEESWWREFREARSRITDELDNALGQRVATEKAKEEAEVDGLIARLHKLADDARFAKLPTQKAMLQYALRQIPELDSIDPSDLKRNGTDFRFYA